MDQYQSLIIHCSGSALGGAERSVLNRVSVLGERPILFVLPGPGTLVDALDERGLPFCQLKWPGPLRALHQRQPGRLWILLPLLPLYALPFMVYWMRLLRLARPYQTLWSSGVKSHCLVLPLLWARKVKVVFDVRDFIRPRVLRGVISRAARMGWASVVANSAAVAKDYLNVEVRYPRVALKRPAQNRRKHSGLVISHVAFFAPYKGQDIFLRYALEISRLREDAEFWIIGDVIYPGRFYQRYKNKLRDLAAGSGLGNRVKFLGAVEDVQPYLEQSHYLLHSTREPEPFGRVVYEGLLCGCKVLCHGDSGVCELPEVKPDTEPDPILGKESLLSNHRFFKLKI